MYPLSPPLLSDSFFAPGTPQAPQGSAGGGGGEIQVPALPDPYRKLEGGCYRRCQEPIKAGFFLPDLRT